MAVLALSVVGAGISSAAGLGASIGWMVGSLVGNLLFQKKGPNTQGPRLTDLQVQSSTEGAPIPIVYGRMRIAGNMIWSSGIRETKTKKKQGGKGMGGSSTHTTYSYDATFAIGLCEGPIQGIRKIWADGKLIYSNASNVSAATLYASKKKMANITVYLGTETQTADPIIAANVGAGSCPAFRGLAYILFNRLQLADFGNRIPNITVEVVTGAEGTYLWRVNTWVNTFNTVQVEVANGVVTTETRTHLGSGSYSRRIYKRDFAGNILSDVTTRSLPVMPTGTANTIQGVSGRPSIGYFTRSFQNISNALGWVVNDTFTENDINMGQWGDSRSFMTDNPNRVYLNGYIFSTTSNLDMDNINRRAANGVVRWTVKNGNFPGGEPDRYADFSTNGLGYASPRSATSELIRRISPTDEGTLLLNIHSDNDIYGANVLEVDLDLNVIKTYSFDLSNGGSYNDVAWRVRNGKYMVDTNTTNQLRLWEEISTGVWRLARTVIQDSNNELIWPMGNGLVLTRYGVYSIYPPITPPTVTVGSIVADICQRCGLTSGFRNTSQLTQTVDGYVITQPMTGRSAIEPLGQAFFFDAVESDYVLKFVKRPGTIVATLEEGDLGAGIDRPTGEDFKRRRMQELELPVEVRVSYMDVNNDFLPGLQASRRLTTESKHTVDLQFAIAMSSTYAAQVADITMRNVWAERMSYEFSLTREFLQLDPCDLVNMPDGNTIRLVQTDFTDPGLVRASGLLDISGGYTSNAVGNSSSHEYPQEVPIIGPTETLLLDIAPLRDEDSTPGFYVAAYGPLAGWKGAEIVRSTDGGNTFEPLDVVTTEAVVGVTSTVLGVPQHLGAFDLSAGVTVVLTTPGATLSSISDTALLAGGNAILIGSEIIQFGVATLTATATYRLTRLLRGRLGTHINVSGHAIGERVVLLNSDLRFLVDGIGNANLSMLYRSISFGATQDEATDQTFSFVGNSVRNPPPVNCHVGLELSGTYHFDWFRCNRTSWWWSATRMPLPDVTESYLIEIFDTDGVTLKASYTATSEGYDWTEAQQLAAFGYLPYDFVAKISQYSDFGLAGHRATVLPNHPKRGRYLSLQRILRPVLQWRRIFDATPDDYSYHSSYDGTSGGSFSHSSSDWPVVNETTGTSVLASVLIGAGGYGQRADSGSPLLDITGPMSLGVWVKFTTTNTVRTIIGKWDSATAADQAYRIGIGSAAGSLRFQVNIGGTVYSAQHSGSYNDDQWHHVVGVFGPDLNIRLYVNGVLRTTTAVVAGTIQSGAANFRIGNNSNGTEQYEGRIFDPTVYNRPLTTAMVADINNCARGNP